MKKCGDCANFIPDCHMWGGKVRWGGCKIAPFRTDKYGQTIKVNRLISRRACKKFIALYGQQICDIVNKYMLKEVFKVN